MNIITDPLFYVLAVPLVLLFGMGKGGLGPGLGTLSVPILSFVISPIEAAAIILPILCVADIFAVYHFRRHFDIGHLKILIPAGIIGIIIAAIFMSQLNQNAMRLLIGVIAIVFCLDHWLRPDVTKMRVMGRWGGYFWGSMAGFTSTQIHAGAAPISIYLYPQKLDRVILIGTMTMFFTAINYVKLIPYTLLGALKIEILTTSIVLMPLAPVGVKLGNMLLHRINQKTFYAWLYLVLFLSGIKLCWDGLF